tara:strand:- start:176 stop:418 length:243 start_codon:yes stop_codon:yes gene_type:complete
MEKNSREIYEKDNKELNTDKFSKKKHSKKTKTKGSRPVSPWYHLIGKVERQYLDKEDTKEDFSVQDFAPVKIKIKNKKGV